jgi:benzoyl-CoA reductase/2-hydroxyglutaryl-CoA dehydratase subunit BcrC/BadD/HgdB
VLFRSDLIEAKGGSVVVDDTCIGTRTFSGTVEINDDPLGDLCRLYFAEFLCPKVIRSCEASRFAYLLELARDFQVKGVIAYLMAWCDPHKFDQPVLRDFLSRAGYPLLAIEDDYTMSSAGPIGNRVQAFLEMLQHKD